MAVYPDIRDIEWVSIDTIFNSWLSIDSSEIRLGPQERTYHEWMLLMKRKRGDDQDYEYKDLVEIMDQKGFQIPLPYRVDLNTNDKIKSDGHHRLVVAFDLGYKFIPYVKVLEHQEAFFILEHFKSEDLVTLLHPENPIPKSYRFF